MSSFGENTYVSLVGTDEILWAGISAGAKTSEEGGKCFE